MYLKTVCVVFFVSLCYVQQLCGDTCRKSEGCGADKESKENFYTEEANIWSDIVAKIRGAEADYVTCQGHSCSCYSFVKERDLAQFSGGVSRQDIDESARVPRATKYQVINKQLFRSRDCMFPFRCRGIEYFLKQIVGDLPDTEFVVNTRDWPQSNKHLGQKLPVFSFSKTEDFSDIMYPAWTFWEGGPAISLYPTGLGRWDKHRTSLIEASEKWHWDSKKDLAFFRGSRTSGERDPLVLLSRKYPGVVDAAYTKNQAWKSDKDTLGAAPADEVSLESHCQYKYLFNYRGVAASFRFKHLFLCKSVVFHVGQDWLEFFYPAMKPWIHYIPVESNAKENEILHLLNFVKLHQDLAQKIARQGFEFVKEHLKMEDVTCYWKELLKSYTNLLRHEIVRDPNVFPIDEVSN